MIAIVRDTKLAVERVERMKMKIHAALLATAAAVNPFSIMDINRALICSFIT